MHVHNKIYFFIMLVLGFMSCHRNRTVSVERDTVRVVHDSIVNIETVKYDTFVIPADSVYTITKIECDSVKHTPKPLSLRTSSKQLMQYITLKDNGNLAVYCASDSLIKIIASKDKLIGNYRIALLQDSFKKDETKIITKKYIPKWIWMLLSCSLGLNIWAYRKPIANTFFTLIKWIP